MATLNMGTKQYVPVRVRDLSRNVTSLETANCRYTLERVADEVAMYTDEDAQQVLGMVIYCLIDTTTGGPWETGVHSLWVRFDEDPEVPYLGPITVQVIE